MGGRWLKNMSAEERGRVEDERKKARRARGIKHYARDVDASRARLRSRYARNGSRIRELARQAYDPIRDLARRLRRKYKLSLVGYLSRFHLQGERCRCCKVTESARWCVDHDHQTGAVRGIVCPRCNSTIGILGDTVEAVESSSAMYLTYLRSA